MFIQNKFGNNEKKSLSDLISLHWLSENIEPFGLSEAAEGPVKAYLTMQAIFRS